MSSVVVDLDEEASRICRSISGGAKNITDCPWPSFRIRMQPNQDHKQLETTCECNITDLEGVCPL